MPDDQSPPKPQERPGELGFRPLYAQVRERILAGLIDGTWPPGALLPSEQQIAASLGVSPGTVRKALDEMAQQNLVVRRQGRGTYVAEHDQDRTLFRYFMLTADDGERCLPESRKTALARARATARERARLALGPRASVWRIDRDRLLGGRTVIAERIILPAAMFPDIDRIERLPNNVYQLYAEQFSVSIARASERLKAILADADDAARLSVPPHTALLQIDRTAYALDGRPVELRLSRCLTDTFHYLSNLS